MRVTVVFADVQAKQQETLDLPSGSMLQHALERSALAARVRQAHPQLTAGIWNHVRPLDTLLQEGDRIELYKPLLADPKDARRTRVERSREQAQAKKAAARRVTSKR
jgi:uncharacterized protein